MAKKGTAPKKGATKKAAARKVVKQTKGKKKQGQSRRAVEQALAGPLRTRARAKVEEDRRLPGMETPRNPRLDDACRTIAEVRATMAECRADEAASQQTALNEMKKDGLHAYRQYGVELARVPGEEKLRVRTSKGTPASAESDDGKLDDNTPDDLDAGDAGDGDLDNE